MNDTERLTRIQVSIGIIQTDLKYLREKVDEMPIYNEEAVTESFRKINSKSKLNRTLIFLMLASYLTIFGYLVFN